MKLKRWVVTLRRTGGATYQPVVISAADKAQAITRAKTEMAEAWNVEPDTLEIASAQPADPTRPPR
jgi:hypothetical protein